VVIGNVIEKGAAAVNRFAVHFGGEGAASYPGSSLLLKDNLLINDRASGATVLYNHSRDGTGQAYPVTMTGNTAYHFDALYDLAFASRDDVFSANVMIAGPAPPLDTAHPWRLADAASAPLVGVALFALAAHRRRSRPSRRPPR
jgi:hypothetical protein